MISDGPMRAGFCAGFSFRANSLPQERCVSDGFAESCETTESRVNREDRLTFGFHS